MFLERGLLTTVSPVHTSYTQFSGLHILNCQQKQCFRPARGIPFSRQPCVCPSCQGRSWPLSTESHVLRPIIIQASGPPGRLTFNNPGMLLMSFSWLQLYITFVSDTTINIYFTVLTYMSGCFFKVPPYLCEKVLKNLPLIQIDLSQLMCSFRCSENTQGSESHVRKLILSFDS